MAGCMAACRKTGVLFVVATAAANRPGYDASSPLQGTSALARAGLCACGQNASQMPCNTVALRHDPSVLFFPSISAVDHQV